MDTLTFLTSFLGGGILGALINWARAERSEKKEREINFLDKQIRELYGPLYYFVAQAKILFKLKESFIKGWKKDDRKYSQDPATQKIFEEKTSLIFEISNKYINCIKTNNDKIKAILDEKYSLTDPEDVDVFLVFFEDYIRMQTEINEDGKLKTPLDIYKHVGDISFLNKKFIEVITEKFFSKKKQLEKLLKK